MFPGAGQVAVVDAAVIGVDEPDAMIIFVCFDRLTPDDDLAGVVDPELTRDAWLPVVIDGTTA